jgi:Tfp pilus assembly protein PilV
MAKIHASFQEKSKAFPHAQGFSLIESLIAVFMLTFGLLATGQILYTAAGLGHLARSKSTAVIAAQHTLEFLSDLYQRNPDAAEFAPGKHGPIQNQVVNPVTGQILNQYNISWISEIMVDTDSSESPRGRIIRVAITPISASGQKTPHSMLTKTLTVTLLIHPNIP